jgi:hypothetical protein
LSYFFGQEEMKWALSRRINGKSVANDGLINEN